MPQAVCRILIDFYCNEVVETVFWGAVGLCTCNYDMQLYFAGADMPVNRECLE